MDLQSAVFAVDNKVRYCGVLDEMGRTISGGMKPGLKSLEPGDEAERVDLQVVIARGMAQSGTKFLGKADYIIIHRERLMLIALPRNDGNTVLVTAEPDFPLEKLGPLMHEVDRNYIS